MMMQTQQIGAGDIGTAATLRKMRQLVNASLTDPVVVQTARSLAAQTFPRDRDSQAQLIKEYLSEHFYFVADPRGVELLTTPRFMLQDIAKRNIATGDCDEAAILGAALGKAIGLPARFVVLGFGVVGASFAHVYTILRGGSRWFSLDVTKPQRGPFPPVTRQATVEV